jgi:predicted MFS family arabinose efflux permease
MAISGMTIGLSFTLAMILGPLVAPFIQVSGIFWLAVFFSGIGILLLLTVVPNDPHMSFHSEAEPELSDLPSLLKHTELVRLNVGVFFLHAIFTASFVIVPIGLQKLAGLHGNQQWILYLPILLLAFLFTIPCIILSEKKHLVKEFFIGGVFLLSIAESLLWIFSHSLLLSAFSLLLFFTAFSFLEASLPSLVSKTAPAKRKGTALGIYSSSQFFGIFVGGTMGGWLYGTFGLTEVHLFCATLALIWLAIAFTMKNPQYSSLI